MTGENLLGSGTASAVMSTLLSLSKAVHGRVVNEPLDRAAREREFDAVTELHRVDLSPENRFEARPLRENSTATRTFRVTFAMAKNAGVRLS